jgi:hypothetical protein
MNFSLQSWNLMENLEKSFPHRAFDDWMACLHLVAEDSRESIQTKQKNLPRIQ